jgi:hypothetical protein
MSPRHEQQFLPLNHLVSVTVKIKARITSICCKQRFLTPQTLLFWRAHYLIVPSSVLHLPECTVICRSSITNHSPFNGCSVDGWYGDVCLDRTPLEYVPPSLAHPKTDRLTIVVWTGLPWSSPFARPPITNSCGLLPQPTTQPSHGSVVPSTMGMPQ